jgi:hypothetical protein
MFRAIGHTMLFAASMAMRGIAHVARDAHNYLWQRAGPQGAAEVSHAIFSQSSAFVPYGHAQAPVKASASANNNALSTAKWSDRFSQGHTPGRSQGMSQGM